MSFMTLDDLAFFFVCSKADRSLGAAQSAVAMSGRSSRSGHSVSVFDTELVSADAARRKAFVVCYDFVFAVVPRSATTKCWLQRR